MKKITIEQVQSYFKNPIDLKKNKLSENGNFYESNDPVSKEDSGKYLLIGFIIFKGLNRYFYYNESV